MVDEVALCDRSAPKFPRPAEINALLHDHLRSSDGDDASGIIGTLQNAVASDPRRLPFTFRHCSCDGLPSFDKLSMRRYRLSRKRFLYARADRSLRMALFSLQKMAAGGMYDHVGAPAFCLSVSDYNQTEQPASDGCGRHADAKDPYLIFAC